MATSRQQKSRRAIATRKATNAALRQGVPSSASKAARVNKERARKSAAKAQRKLGKRGSTSI